MRRRNENTAIKFNKISIGLCSPESILSKSRGEVLKPETINYRTHKPERDGLFCERIFGPVRDYECACGKYKRIRYKGIVCDRCGVEVTEKKVRRDRIGHINLVVPVAHIWYFRSLPNKIGYLLGLPSKKLDMIIYYERYVVIQPGIAKDQEGNDLNKMDFLTEEEYLNVLDSIPHENMYLEDSDPDKFIAKMGAECLIELLSRINLDDLSFVETHDCFTIAELIEYEAMGLTKLGEGYKAIEEGWVQKNGRLPINPSGGLKSKGHPVGATGVSQHVMSAMQLTGEADDMQVKDAKLAGIFNMGGASVANYVSILERIR